MDEEAVPHGGGPAGSLAHGDQGGNTLRSSGIRFALTGGCAVYARGGPASDHDVDVFIKERDAAAARQALIAAGMRAVDPPEDWLTKVYDGDNLVDLIFHPNLRAVTDEMLDRAEELRIGPTVAPVLPDRSPHRQAAHARSASL